jgi:hypothetical protein
MIQHLDRQKLTATIAQKKYALNLIKRLALINYHYSLKSEYEKNEVEINQFETKETLHQRLQKISKMEGEIAVLLFETPRYISKIAL